MQVSFMQPLAQVKTAALAQIDELAVAARAPHITQIPGQSYEYARKRDQAAAYLAEWQRAQADPDNADYIDPGNYPWLAAQDGGDLQAAAQRILAAAAQADAALARIAGLRDAARDKVKAAADSADVYRAVIWMKDRA